jgi:hypothetical protein
MGAPTTMLEVQLVFAGAVVVKSIGPCELHALRHVGSAYSSVRLLELHIDLDLNL